MWKWTKYTLAVLTLLALSGIAFADDDDYRYRDRDDRYSGYDQKEWREHQKLYDKGFRDGRKDREKRRPFEIRYRGGDDRRDQRAYAAGYRAGYGSYSGWYPDRDRDGRDDRYERDHGYGWYGGGAPRYSRQAYNIGYQDGLRHGSTDRRTGHSYRPTQHDDYKDGDNGYNSSYGSKQLYKDTYRQGFTEGYQRGWNGGW
jgi:hypothetical protein